MWVGGKKREKKNKKEALHRKRILCQKLSNVNSTLSTRALKGKNHQSYLLTPTLLYLHTMLLQLKPSSFAG